MPKLLSPKPLRFGAIRGMNGYLRRKITLKKIYHLKIARIDSILRRNTLQFISPKSLNEHVLYAAKVPSLGPNGSSS